MWGKALFIAVALLVAGVSGAAAAEPPQHVLILHSFGPRFAPFNAFTSAFREDLVHRASGPLAMSEVSIEAARIAGPDNDAAILDYLHGLFSRAPPDLMVTIGGPAAHFAQAHRPDLFPEAPLLVTAVEARRIDRATRGARDVVVSHVIDVPGLVETILEVQPGTREILVVLGASPLERQWQRLAEDDLRGFEGRIAFEWTNDLEFDAILRRVAALPADAAVIYGLMIVDAAGVPFEEDQAIAALAAASAVPIYGIYDNQIGQGVLGGRMLPVPKLAEQAAEVARRLLAGEPPGAISVEPVVAGPPTFDARQLRRFGIAAHALPADSQLLFLEPTAWDRYRGPILAAIALSLVQTAFITGLVASRRRGRRSEAALTASEARLRDAVGEARDFAGRLIRAQEDERSRLGRELHDDITQRLAVLAIEVGRCERAAADPGTAAPLAGVRTQLARLSDDVHALSYQLHPSILADLGLVAALEAEAERAGRVEGLPVELATEGVPETVARPVALCLYRVTQEALRNVARHAGARAARVTVRREGDSIRLTVEDDGAGFDPDAVRGRPSLGLASMRQRVVAVGGTLRIDAAAGRGTRVEVEVPVGISAGISGGNSGGGTGDDAAAAVAR